MELKTASLSFGPKQPSSLLFASPAWPLSGQPNALPFRPVDHLWPRLVPSFSPTFFSNSTSPARPPPDSSRLSGPASLSVGLTPSLHQARSEDKKIYQNKCGIGGFYLRPLGSKDTASLDHVSIYQKINNYLHLYIYII